MSVQFIITLNLSALLITIILTLVFIGFGAEFFEILERRRGRKP